MHPTRTEPSNRAHSRAGRRHSALLVAAVLAACSPAPPATEVAGPYAGEAETTPATATPFDSFSPATPGELGTDPVEAGSPPPGFASGPEVIGWSVESRPVEMYRFGYGPSQKLIVAGIHGGYEWNTIALAHELIAYVQAHPGIIPTDTTLFFLPALNPDGAARSHGFEGRANAHGVDLNRNWDANWQADWPRSGCWDYLPISSGTGPGSEPEAAALLAFFSAHSIQTLISYHSAALGIFPGGQPPAEGSARFAAELARVTAYPYPPLDNGCVYTGQFTDWASDQGVVAADVELSNHTDTDFEVNLEALEVFLAWK